MLCPMVTTSYGHGFWPYNNFPVISHVFVSYSDNKTSAMVVIGKWSGVSVTRNAAPDHKHNSIIWRHVPLVKTDVKESTAI